MGEIVVDIELENDHDRSLFREGHLQESDIRTAQIQAVADTGAVMLALPEDVVSELGVPETGTVEASLADGSPIALPVVGNINIFVSGRRAETEAIVLPSGATPLVGQIVMERLDLIADCRRRTLMPRSTSPDRPMLRL